MPSSSTLEFIANPTVVEVVKCPRPVFKIIPEVAKHDDTLGAFSKIPKGVAYTEDPTIYIHFHIEELGTDEIMNMYRTVICDENGIVKPEHKIIETLGFVEILDILDFPKEVVRIVLSRVHGELFWLDSTYKITREVVKAVTCLPSIDSRLDKSKKVPNNTMMTLTGATRDNRSLRVNDVKYINVRFISMILGYKTTHSNRLNSISSLCIKSAYGMVNSNTNIDICEWLKNELINNLKKIKGDKKGTFRFGNLLVCLMLYITKEVRSIGRKEFGFDIPVGKQLLDILTSMGDDRENNIIEYFQAFKARMKIRERLSQSIVDKYQKKICFVIKKDEI